MRRPASFLHAPPLLRFWPAAPVPTQEDYLFPGVTAVVVTLVALLTLAGRRRQQPVASADSDAGARLRPALLFYAVATLVMWACAFGPGLASSGLDAWIRPYRWLALLPGYDGLRVPARFAMLGAVCLATAAGLAVARLQSVIGRAFPAATLLVLAGLGLDGLMRPVPLGTPPPRVILPAAAGAAVIELPADDARVEVAAMYRQMEHERPIVNGYSGYSPPHYTILSLALRRGDSSPLRYLAAGQPLIVVVNDQLDTGGDFKRMVEGLPSIERTGVDERGNRLPAAGAASGAAGPGGRRPDLARQRRRRRARGHRSRAHAGGPRRDLQPPLALPGARRAAADRAIRRRAVVGTGVDRMDRRARGRRRDRGSVCSRRCGCRCPTSAPATSASIPHRDGWHANS